MPFPLHKVPRGLLELMRLRVLGANPPQFGETVLPIVDATEFYAADLKTGSSSAPTVGSIAGAGLTEVLTLTGPIRLHGLGATLTIGTGAATNVSIAARVTIGTVTVPVATAFYASVNAGAPCWAGLAFGNPWVLPPDYSVTLSARASGTNGAADHSLLIAAIVDNITGAL